MQKTDKSLGFSIIELSVVVAVILILGLVGYFVYKHKQTSSQSKPVTTTQNSSATNNTNSRPILPTSGAYLGAWVNPGKGTGTGGQGSGGGNPIEISNLSNFNSSLGGKSVKILHLWSSFKTTVATITPTLNAISKNGSIPIINWGCSDVSGISNGSQDSIINGYADGLKAYGKPVFLRWYWEFNEMSSKGKTPAGSSCNGYNNGPGFIAAWQHIYTLFKNDGVNNVSFVWCPGYSGGNFSTYYPGDNYVDWIGIDRYERTTGNKPLLSFTDMFKDYYSQFSNHGKPIMIAETAAMGSSNQSIYLSSAGSEMPNFPDIKAFVYFDSIGPAGDWSLISDGLNTYINLNNNSYFNNK
jgi:prepilin-type N-terminal cleavage/methylation domain-containing protein